MESESDRLKQEIRKGTSSFEKLAVEIFHFQAKNNPIYRQYMNILGVILENINTVQQIPFLPIRFFKTHAVQSGSAKPEKIFESSGTSQALRSKHWIADLNWYQYISSTCFEAAFGQNIDQVKHLGLLPSYASNPASSLLFMIDYFISNGGGAYFHEDQKSLIKYVCDHPWDKIIIWGVSYAFWKWETEFPKHDNLLIIETGGMKGKEKEVTRMELHQNLISKFKVSGIVSEYGMTELLSQAYALKDGIFSPGPTMKVLPRSIYDPLSSEKRNTVAAANIIDLANIDSCSFIATDDLCKVYADGRFEILGRLDASDLRGCNLLV